MYVRPQPNHQEYLKALQQLGAAGRFQKMLQLSQFAKDFFLHGLRKRFPEKTEAQIKELYLQRLLEGDKEKIHLFSNFRNKSSF